MFHLILTVALSVSLVCSVVKSISNSVTQQRQQQTVIAAEKPEPDTDTSDAQLNQ